jgi:hypothetical protein
VAEFLQPQRLGDRVDPARGALRPGPGRAHQQRFIAAMNSAIEAITPTTTATTRPNANAETHTISDRGPGVASGCPRATARQVRD